MSFKGKYYLHFDDDCFQHGLIADYFDGIILIRMDHADEPEVRASLSAVCVAEVLEDYNGKNYGAWQFFETEQQLKDQLAWVDKLHDDDKTPKIVSIK